jgi:alpha-glucosidase (family GH31 glycosyl hydrolase)
MNTGINKLNSKSEKTNSIICCGKARFTVITPMCIRLEYNSKGTFINAPSWLAVNRDVRCSEFICTEDKNSLQIETQYFKLIYKPDGTPFSETNLTGKIKSSKSISWAYGQKNKCNLGGTLSTLDSLDAAVPLPEGLLSKDGWYLLDDSSSPLFTDNWFKARPANSGIDAYLFAYGQKYKKALQSFTALAGNVPLPRKYVLGSWYSRWYPYTAEDYQNIVEEYDEHDFPLDIMVMDMDWHRQKEARSGKGWANMLGWTGWSWNKKLIPQPTKLLDFFHDKDISVTLNVHPHDGIRKHENCYDSFMRELDYDPRSAKALPFKVADQKYMQAYFKHSHAPLEKQGVDFWWVDWQQDSIIPFAKGQKGSKELKHLPLLNYSYYTHTAKKNKRGLSFSRWAEWGDHRYPIHFSGDASCTWEMLAFEIFFTATAGNVGCFFWSHDIGGFCGKKNPEQYARWAQFGVTTAAVRLHSAGSDLDRRPWKWPKEVENSIRKSFKLRAELIPYIYSAIWDCHKNSLPLNRPMYLEYPEINKAYSSPYQYLLGDAFLVAPVIKKGQGSNKEATTSCWIPKGNWFDWFTGEQYNGPGIFKIRNDLNTFPLLVKGGYPVTLQPYSNRMTSTPLETLKIRCFYLPNTQITSQLYQDDGLSENYKKGEFSLTNISFSSIENKAEIKISAIDGQYKEMLKKRSYHIELCNAPKVLGVIVNKKKAIHKFDKKKQCCYVSIDKISVAKNLNITFNFLTQ